MLMEISPADAKAKHGISTLHHRMDNNELRFRLKKTDGTAYIRTEAASTGSWQESHFHKAVMETYVVQSGWMAFADLVDDRMRVRIFGPNEIVTSRPGVIHNVYLPGGAVIHTVKHGEAEGDDRTTNAATAAFDLVATKLESEAEIRAAAIRANARLIYSEEYRHFDNLIWQVPAWSTAVFALSIQSVSDILNHSDSSLSQRQWAAVLLCFSAACLLCFSLVLARFRIHQRGVKGYSSTPRWKSASTWSQGLITLEAMALVGMALVLLTVPMGPSTVIGVIAGALILLGTEQAVRRGKIQP